MLCTFCKRDVDDVAEGPEVAICASCASGTGAVEGGASRCSFCNKPERQSRLRWRNRKIVLRTADATICSQCAAIAVDVIAHRR